MITALLLSAALSVTPIDQAWLDARTPPYQLDQTGETYVLETDIATPVRAFKVRALDVVLDLNGHTITFDDAQAGHTNYSFEDDLTGWTLPPNARRVPVSTRPLHGDWYLEVDRSDTDQVIVSDWFELPPDQDCTAYTLRANTSAYTRDWMRLEVEHESLGIVAGVRSTYLNSFRFRSPSAPGRYRIRCTIEAEDQPVWQPNTEYKLGSVVRPTGHPANIAFELTKVGTVYRGTAGDTEPEWSTELGGITVDGDIEWVTRMVGTQDAGSVWQPNKLYQVRYSYVVPTVRNGCVYEPIRIRLNGATSGDTEPVWYDYGTRPTADGELAWSPREDDTFRIDMIDARPRDVWGVEFRWWGSGDKPFTIRNGTIKQGRAGSYHGHAIYCGGGNGIIIEGLEIETNGLESSAIFGSWGNDYTIRNNLISTSGRHKFNRHQLAAAVQLPYTTGSIVEGNTINSGEGWGGVYSSHQKDTEPNVIQGNTVNTQSVITNHYGIMAYGYGQRVIDNVINCDPGQGLRLSKNGNLAEGNTININSVSPNWDTGRLSLDAIRLNDYNSAHNAASDNVVRNNTISLAGRNSTRYERNPQILNGITNVSAGSNNVFEGNTITAIKVDPEVVVSGLMPGNTGDELVWRDNTVTSDQFAILFGHYAGQCRNTLFQDNRFVKGENAGEDYAVLHSHGGRFNVQDVRFIGNQLIGGGDFREIYGGVTWSYPSNYTVGGVSEVTVDLHGEGYRLTGLQIRDKDGVIVHEGGGPATLGGGYAVEFKRQAPYWFYTGESDSGAPYSVTGMVE